MSTSRTAIALFALTAAAPLAACDAEVPEELDYQAVGHLDVVQLQKAAWIEQAITTAAIDSKSELGPCVDVLSGATAITFGAGEDTFEAYLRGTIDPTTANGCSDHLEAATQGEEGRQPEAVMLADDLFVVFAGDFTPSEARLERMQASAPAAGKPAWLVTTVNEKDSPIKRLQAWATVNKGLDAHVDVQFNDGAKATEMYGQANLGLAAMRLSDDTGDLASMITLEQDGKKISADVRATPKQLEKMKKLASEHKGRDAEDVKAFKAKVGHGKHKRGPGIHVQIGSAN